jgi:hypothetical protein
MKTTKERTPTATHVRNTQNLRRSGASGVHADRRLRRQRTRASAKAQALREG